MKTAILCVFVLVGMGCKPDPEPFPPACGLSQAELDEATELARLVAPSEKYDLNENGFVDLEDIAQLRIAAQPCP